MIPENKGKVFHGAIKPGEVRNPRGNPNPNIGEIAKKKATGPRTDEGKLKNSLSLLKHGRNSKLIGKMRNCNYCPLKEKTKEIATRDGIDTMTIPAKCTHYKAGSKCLVPQIDFIKKLRLYYEIGEKLGTKELAKAINYRILEAAELAQETEIIEDRKPGFYSHKFLDLAAKNTESINKQEYGEKTTNLNVNVDLNAVIIDAWKDREDKVVDVKKEGEDEISLCKDGCNCMTKTIDNKCGKCGVIKER